MIWADVTNLVNKISKMYDSTQHINIDNRKFILKEKTTINLEIGSNKEFSILIMKPFGEEKNLDGLFLRLNSDIYNIYGYVDNEIYVAEEIAKKKNGKIVDAQYFFRDEIQTRSGVKILNEISNIVFEIYNN